MPLQFARAVVHAGEPAARVAEVRRRQFVELLARLVGVGPVAIDDEKELRVRLVQRLQARQLGFGHLAHHVVRALEQGNVAAAGLRHAG